MESSKKVFFLLLLTVFLGNIFLRTYHIRSTPPLLSSDEIQYLAEARALMVSGKGLIEGWSPFSFTASHGWYAELPSSVLVPAQYLFQDDPILAAKMTHIVMGSLIPVILGLLLFTTIPSRRLAIISAFLATLNPWLFQLSRLSFESYFSLFFYLLGWLLFQQKRIYLQLLSAGAFFLGFFQYQGHKVVLVPLVGVILCFRILPVFFAKTRKERVAHLKNQRLRLVIFAFTILLTGWYALRLPSQNTGERISVQLAPFDTEHLHSVVNTERRLSFDSPLRSVFSNKYTVLLEETTRRYLDSFNPVFLFGGGGNASDSWSVTTKGKFYLFDIVLCLLGIGFVFTSTHRRVGMLLIAIIALAPLPGILVSGDLWPMFRTLFLAPSISMLCALGLWWHSRLLSGKKTLVIISIYTLATIPFFYDYFIRYPLYSTTDVYFYDRVLANYFLRAGIPGKTIIVADESRSLFDKILYYNGYITRETISTISASYTRASYIFRDLEVKDTCFDPALETSHSLLVHQVRKGYCATVDEQKLRTKPSIVIANLHDSGAVYTLYGDTFCSRFNLPAYSHVQKNVLAVEALSDQDFCEQFFVQYGKSATN